MSLLQFIEDQPRFAKITLQGPEDSGASRAAVEVALALYSVFGCRGGIAYFDTRGQSDCVRATLRERTGFVPLRCKSRRLEDLLGVAGECLEGAASILIVDSLSEVWRELVAASGDFAAARAQWELWTSVFATASLHIVACGRESGEAAEG
jgi:hypothetical protein